MVAAPLDGILLPIHRVDGLAKRLAAVDDKQTSPVRFHPALDQVFQERCADCRVLTGAVTQAQNMLKTLDIYADGHDHVVSTEHDPVEVNDQDLLVVEAAFGQFLESVFRRLNEL